MCDKGAIKTVLLEITNVCNLQCMHCFNLLARHSKNEFLSLENIKYIIRKCKDEGLNKLYLSGGEPLMHPQIKELIALCGDYPEINFSITTNGLLLTDGIIALIESKPNICVQLSVDGLSKEVYESQRGSGTYEKFYEILNKLTQSKIKILTARTCITRLNYKEIPLIYKSLIERKIAPSFLFVNQMGNAAEQWNILSLSLAQKLSCLAQINALNNRYNYFATPPEPTSTCNFTEKVGVKSLLIKYTGEIAPCQYFYNDSIGNIYNQEISNILCYDNLKRYYDLAQKRKEILSCSTCKDCKINEICSFGCVGMADMRGDILGVDGDCQYRLMAASCYSHGIIERTTSESIAENIKKFKGDHYGTNKHCVI